MAREEPHVDAFSGGRSSGIQTPGLKQASEFNDRLVVGPFPTKPLEDTLSGAGG